MWASRWGRPLPRRWAICGASTGTAASTCRCTLNWDIRCQTEKVGDFDVECVKEFWLGFARSVPATVHFVQFAGENTHHILEAAFKGAGRALADAVRIDTAHRDEIPSTKGLLV